MMKMINWLKKVKLVTHSGAFHADDVYACAILQIYLDTNGIGYKVIRTRDPEIISRGDYVFDVGNVYDHSQKRYDHHQNDMNEKRDNGIPYAAAGLAWRHYGNEITDPVTFKKVDEKIITVLDADDSGITVTSTKFPDVKEYNLSAFIASFRPTWQEADSALGEQFNKAVLVAKDHLQRVINKYEVNQVGAQKAKEIYLNQDDPSLIILEEKFPIFDLPDEYPEIKWQINYNRIDDNWRISYIADNGEDFTARAYLPREWRGLRDEELQMVSGVKTATFCHKDGVYAGAKTKEDAIRMAKASVDQK